MSSSGSDSLLDSNRYYNGIGGSYAGLSLGRKNYLQGVDTVLKNLHIPEKSKWLDIGSGDGARALLLARETGWRLSVSEPTTLLNEKFELENPEVSVIRKSAEEIPVGFGEFDVVTLLWNVLGHVDSPQAVLSKAWKLLRPGGTIFFDVNNFLNLRNYGVFRYGMNYLRSRSGELIFSIPQNDEIGTGRARVRLFSKDGVENNLQRCGFREILLSFVDYETGRVVRRSSQGQIVAHAIK
jgi:SAM-dependent methyltransferase